MGLLDELRNAGQGASRTFWAGGLGGPADLATLLANTAIAAGGYVAHKAGLVNSPPDLLGPSPFGSERIADRMRSAGLLNDLPGSAGDRIGEASGLLLPLLAQAKAPQIAGGLLRAFDNASVPRGLNAQAGVLNMGGGRLSRAEFDEMKRVIREIEKAAELHGTVFARWSPSVALDFKPGARSRDFVSGQTHKGLSAVPISSDMHPVDIAKSINEYSFLRAQDRRNMPKIYIGEQVGVDSDGYASIVPRQLAMEIGKKHVSALDRKFVEAFELEDSIRKYQDRIARGATAWKDSLDKAIEKLSIILD